MSRVSDVHCPKKLETNCNSCSHINKVVDGSHGGINYYCTKKEVVC